MADVLPLAPAPAAPAADPEPVFPRDYGECLVIEEQPETYVFVNGAGAVVVRQVGPAYSDDPAVYIRPEYARRLCDAIMAAAGLPREG